MSQKKIKTRKINQTKKVNKEGYYNSKSGKFVGPYNRTAKQFPTHYVTQRIDPKTGELRWVEVTKFDDNLERKIRSEENRLKEINKDPAKTKKAQEQYKTSELRMYNLVSMLESRGYYGYDTNSLREKMIELKNGENDEIVNDFINTTLKDEYGNDSDMLYVDDKRIKDDYDKTRAYYEQKSYNEYLEYLEQEQLNTR